MFKKLFTGLFYNLFYQAVSLIVLVSLAFGVIWAYAAFTEPSAAPSASNQDFAQNILGADNADNSFASTNVAANNDGSIIERLEYFWSNRTSFGSASGPGGWTCARRAGNSGMTISYATCSGTEKAITGGCSTSAGGILSSFPGAYGGEGWTCQVSAGTVITYVECCQ